MCSKDCLYWSSDSSSQCFVLVSHFAACCYQITLYSTHPYGTAFCFVFLGLVASKINLRLVSLHKNFVIDDEGQ